jgi:hypothetical protein
MVEAAEPQEFVAIACQLPALETVFNPGLAFITKPVLRFCNWYVIGPAVGSHKEVGPGVRFILVVFPQQMKGFGMVIVGALGGSSTFTVAMVLQTGGQIPAGSETWTA